MNATSPLPSGKASSSTSSSTFGNEDDLPRVPLPTLEATRVRFLEWCAPLLTDEQYTETEAALTAFTAPGGPGARLHAALAEFNDRPGVRSWLDVFWPYRYLGRRDRIALNANFVFLFRDADLTQVDRATELIVGAVDYKLRLDREEIPPVVQRGQPLSMAQNTFLFSTTRIPGAVQDTVRTPYSQEWPGPSRARHIVVFYRASLFRLEVLDSEDRPYSREELRSALRAIMKTEVRPESQVGHLTTMARAEWAATRDALLAADPGNRASLDEIETALFCLCLEDVAPADTLTACDQLLHGDSGNRWFDKAVSFVVFADGRAGINVEHCGLDGTTILSFVDTVLTGSPEDGPVQGPPAVEPVEFVLTDELRDTIASAAASFAQYAADTASVTVSFPDFGSARAKELKVSPDAFVQMAYQLAHRRAKGFVGATYESIATRQYQGGRTEAMRVVTPESVRFVEAMDDPAADAATRRAAFRAAAEAHVARARQCQAGDAPEQHLWELQLIQKRRGEELGVTEPLDFFTSPGWLITRDDYLSTSSAPSTNIEFFGFGSTSSHCIGVAYVLLPDRFNVYLSTPRSVAGQMYDFADRLRAAVTELDDLLA